MEQLVIMNASSFVGQLCSTVLVGHLSVPTLTIIATFCCTVILFGMIGVHTVAGIVVFGVLYGYFSGICASFLCLTRLDLLIARPVFVCPVLALWTPIMALLSPDLSELGYVKHAMLELNSANRIVHRVRMGIICATMGTPFIVAFYHAMM